MATNLYIQRQTEQAVIVATRYAPAPLLPPWAPQLLAQRSISFPSHAQYVLTVTAAPALHVKAAVRKVAW